MVNYVIAPKIIKGWGSVTIPQPKTGHRICIFIRLAFFLCKQRLNFRSGVQYLRPAPTSLRGSQIILSLTANRHYLWALKRLIYQKWGLLPLLFASLRLVCLHEGPSIPQSITYCFALLLFLNFLIIRDPA